MYSKPHRSAIDDELFVDLFRCEMLLDFGPPHPNSRLYKVKETCEIKASTGATGHGAAIHTG